MHTHSTSVHIQCEAIYDNTGVRDVNFMLSKLQMFEVYTYSYSLAKSMLTGSPPHIYIPCILILSTIRVYFQTVQRTNTHQQGPTNICSHITTHQCILIGYFNNCNFSKQSNALPDDGVTAPKHVGAVLMSVLM